MTAPDMPKGWVAVPIGAMCELGGCATEIRRIAGAIDHVSEDVLMLGKSDDFTVDKGGADALLFLIERLVDEAGKLDAFMAEQEGLAKP